MLGVPDEAAEALCLAGVVSGRPVSPGRWELSDNGLVGVVQVGEVTVWVRPKLDIARLVWLIGYAKSPGWRAGDDPVRLGWADDLVPALADAMASQAERALATGLLQGYQELDDELAVLRGRFRAHDQLGRRHGVALPLLVRYDDYTVDTTENRVLRGAVERLLRLPGVSQGARVRLLALRHRLNEVSALAPGGKVPDWTPSRLNARYHDALWLAELVLGGSSVEHLPGALRINGFLVDMAKVFEDFVTSALSASLVPFGGTCRAQDRWWLDVGESIALRPDLVWYRDGRPMAVVDAKYKAQHHDGFPNPDVYQVLAYATALGLPRGELVYAKGNEPARSWTVRNAGVTITAHTLDLAAPPAGVLGQVGRLARHIALSSGAVRAGGSPTEG